MMKDENVSVVQSDEEKRKIPMLYFKRDGYLIPLWNIVTIEKDWEHTSTSSGCSYVSYNIVINKNMVQSDRIKVGEKKFSYSNEETRNKMFDAIVELLCEHNDVTVL